MILRLTAATPLDRERIGGKACGLVRLMRAGFTVPPSWCLPAAARDLGVDSLAALWGQLEATGPGLAVRSSATLEDLPGASFAGIYHTRLGVGGEADLIAAVIECWSSLTSDAARVYRRARGLAAADVGMAVVIQRMVAAEVAGVLFTANPQRPFADEIVIAASYGLGEGVVAASAGADHVVVDGRGDIVEELVGDKASRLQATAAGVAAAAVASPLQHQRCVDRQLLAALVATARRVGERLGPRQDLEWAWAEGELQLLQQRPMVGLPPARPRQVWSRKFGDEYLSGYTTPLTQTLLLPWITDNYLGELARLMGRGDLAAMSPIRNYQGYQYMSGEYLARLLVVVPRGRRAAQSQGWFTPLGLEAIAAPAFSPWLALRTLLAPLGDRRRAPMGANLRALAAHAAVVEAELAPLLLQDYSELSEREWRGQFDRAIALGREHFRIIRWGMGLYNPLLHSVVRELLARSVGAARAGEYYDALVSGLPTRTAALNRSLWSLARAAAAHPELCELLVDGADYSAVRAETARASEFWPRFDQFMACYGHRGGSREISEPRWRDDPATVLGLIRAQLAGSALSPEVAERRAVDRRIAIERELSALVASKRGGRLRRRLWMSTVERLQAYTSYRENQRHYLDFITAHLRGLALERGRRWVASGSLAAAAEVFYLEADELLAAPSPGLSERIARRRRHQRTFGARLPATYLFDGVETEGEICEGPRDERRGQSAGLGVSRGIARGWARAVTSFDQLTCMRPGEVMVARNIDPGWTSVFPLLAAIVTESGGMLSHGALLAREYGIPAVMGVIGAGTSLDGKLVEVDGSRGEVRVVEARERAREF